MKKELNILLYASSFFFLAGGLFMPVYAVFVAEIGGGLSTAGMAYGTFLVVAGILTFVLCKWEDKMKNQEKLMPIGYALGCVAFAGFLFIQKPWHLFVVQGILGVSEAIWRPAFDALYSKYLTKGKSFSEWGRWEGVTYIVMAVASVLGGWIADLQGFRILFLIMFNISLVAFIISTLLIVKEDKKKRNKKKK